MEFGYHNTSLGRIKTISSALSAKKKMFCQCHKHLNKDVNLVLTAGKKAC